MRLRERIIEQQSSHVWRACKPKLLLVRLTNNYERSQQCDEAKPLCLCQSVCLHSVYLPLCQASCLPASLAVFLPVFSFSLPHSPPPFFLSISLSTSLLIYIYISLSFYLFFSPLLSLSISLNLSLNLSIIPPSLEAAVLLWSRGSRMLLSLLALQYCFIQSFDIIESMFITSLFERWVEYRHLVSFSTIDLKRSRF